MPLRQQTGSLGIKELAARVDLITREKEAVEKALQASK